MKEHPALYLAALILLLIICNLTFVYSKGWLRWTCQLFSFGGLFVIYKLAGLNLSDIGLSRDRLGPGLKYGLAVIAVVLIVFVVLYFLNQNIFSDKRYDQSLHKALISALIFLPLQTVLFEELAFRGLMPALLKNFNASFWFALIASAVLFGLWHIASAPRGSLIGINSTSNLLIVAVVFLATTTAGAVLYYLRYRSGSLVAPITVHWFVNGLAIILSSITWLHRA